MGKTKADLERDVANLKAKLAEAGGVPPKEREANEARADSARKSVAGISVDSVVKDITDVSLSTGRALANLTEVLTTKTKQLEEINLALQVKAQDLQTLHDKEVVESSLAALIEDHDRQKLHLQTELAGERLQWADEKAAHAKYVQERNAETEKARARDEDKFNYDRDLRRRTEETTWKNGLEDRKRVESLRSAEFERTLQERDAALKLREAEFNEAKARISGIQAEIDSAVKKEVAIVSNAISREHRHATEIAQRDHAAQVSSVQAQLASTKEENARLLIQVTDLGTKLSEAYGKNVSLSEKALEAASGRQAMAELRDLQTARAENNGQGRKS